MNAKINLTERQKALLIECDKFSISPIPGKGYYRLGGHGYSPIRYHNSTLYKMREHGLVTNSQGYWKITEFGKSFLTI